MYLGYFDLTVIYVTALRRVGSYPTLRADAALECI
jgi:hypothetical protein